ncbi:hypothetical protein PYW07_008020 [Mythimna separata]|uniref:RNA helicase n=1 Tax=Mythimna separata TaxID=271217 RepID=A0AAD8DVB9_MYTSE|nr:hypothetical protein PYW07_008020 [Mythimna separata]
MIDCKVCRVKDVQPEHLDSELHKKNSSLKEFAMNKKQFLNNKKGVAAVSCSVVTSLGSTLENTEGIIKISGKPNENIEFKFALSNESQTDDIHVTDVKLIHNRFNFTINNGPISPECQTLRLAPRNKLLEEIVISFASPNIGQYETAILFYFQKQKTKESVIIMKEMVVFVEDKQTQHDKIESPYEKKGVWAKELLKSTAVDRHDDVFCIPKCYKNIYAKGLKMPDTASQADKDLADDLRKVFSTGVTKENYIKFFHNILWYEETIIRVNIKNYNMSGVKVVMQHHMSGTCYALTVPGLGEKRPSLMIGDLLYIRPCNQNETMFEAVVKEINENVALIGGLHQLFANYYSPGAQFDVRFFMSRIPLERMHNAVHAVKNEGHECRIFPEENKNLKPVKKIINFFNPLVEANLEQRCAVEHMVSGTSGKAPYLLHGPPGTGKTVTIVEAILQLVHNNPENRIMVCTDSNMAADHVATMIIKYSHMFSKENFLLRSNSKFRTWETLPDCLAKYSNGTTRFSYQHVPVEDFMSHSIVITTLSHAAMFGRIMKGRNIPQHITHLFIDEAAQASEPMSLIPVCGLLKRSGALVLAGDPHQLGPVIISRNAHNLGLGMYVCTDIPVCGLLKRSGALVLAGDPHQLGPVIISRNAHNLGLAQRRAGAGRGPAPAGARHHIAQCPQLGTRYVCTDIPVCGLLKRSGALVLAGDPHQLGPVIISRNAHNLGLAQRRAGAGRGPAPAGARHHIAQCPQLGTRYVCTDIPVCGLLKRSGALVLAGDPHQLGPVIISRNAHNLGLAQRRAGAGRGPAPAGARHHIAQCPQLGTRYVCTDIPVCGLLKRSGALVLAGDPHQLGPVIISRNAHNLGLGRSLMERLKTTCPLYSDARSDPNYIVMLRNNFRSNPDILEIPDKLFYKGQLRALAKEDTISSIDILGESRQKSRAVVFHGVLSKEQKIGKSPSFFNMMECEIVKRYVKSLVTMHNVPMQDIGIVTPYIRQVYHIKKTLRELNFDKIEVGTVEAYQGKEKRVIIISTVRANCNLLDHDAKFQLGFLVDDKRFNVAITRAKAKCIIIGNPLCLEKDIKWRMYMQRCRELGTYNGFDSMTEGHDTYSKELVANVTPMLQGLTITVKPMRKKKTVAELVAAGPVPVAVG